MDPVIIEPSEWGNDLHAWTIATAARLREKLAQAGALLFKRTGCSTPDRFEAFARLTSQEFPHFKEESSPRRAVAGAVQTSTDYPNAYSIQFHSEYSYASRWPMKLYFCCFQAPQSGGETPISDTRAVLAGMRPATRQMFERKGILYLRNYRPHVGVAWEKAFSTTDRSRVERTCAELGIEYRWGSDGVLRTRQHGPAIVTHPTTGQAVWFNHSFFFNVHAFEPKSLRDELASFPDDDPFSTNTLFGDGSPITLDIIEEIRSLYERGSIRNRWEQGDVLLIDNMLTAHGRTPFVGKRSIGVLMADAHLRANCY
jgi:alpha-ketoglutarate-dependent taurine dioxygenase